MLLTRLESIPRVAGRLLAAVLCPYETIRARDEGCAGRCNRRRGKTCVIPLKSESDQTRITSSHQLTQVKRPMVLMIAFPQSTLHVAGPTLRPTERLRMTLGKSASVKPALPLLRTTKMRTIPLRKPLVASQHSLVQTVMKRLFITI